MIMSQSRQPMTVRTWRDRVPAIAAVAVAAVAFGFLYAYLINHGHYTGAPPRGLMLQWLELTFLFLLFFPLYLLRARPFMSLVEAMAVLASVLLIVPFGKPVAAYVGAEGPFPLMAGCIGFVLASYLLARSVANRVQR